MALLQIEDLWYQYPLATKAVLRGVNLTVNEGEFLVLLGPSGCGKSTLALTANGIVPNQIGGKIAGTVEIDGMNTRQHAVGELARKVGIVFQNPDAQIIHLHVEDEVAFPMQNLLVQPQVMREKINEMLEVVGMSRFKKSLTTTLSGGQKQRLSIATALTMDPKLLILDEPTVHLDPKGAEEVIDTIVQLNREQNIAILLIEHKLDEIIQVADRIAVMDEGVVVADGDPRELLLNKANYIMNDLGLFIPQVTEVANFAVTRGYTFASAPLSVEDFPTNTIKLRRDGFAGGQNHQGNVAGRRAVIEIRGVSFKYPIGTKALDNISLDVQEGEIAALLGSNGSGKTTLAKILIGLLKPTQGNVTIRGDNSVYDVSKTSPKVLSRFIGFSFQNPENQFVTERVFDEVAFGLRIMNNISEDEIKRRTMGIIEKFGLVEFIDEHPLNLSMGQKRRLSIATMLVLEPRMIIFDEPMTGQDKKRTDFIIKLIQDLQGKGTTSIFITHDMHFVANIATHAIVLNEGKVAFQGSPEKLFNSPEILSQNSLTDPVVHKLAMKFDGQFSSIITVKEFCDVMEAEQ